MDPEQVRPADGPHDARKAIHDPNPLPRPAAGRQPPVALDIERLNFVAMRWIIATVALLPVPGLGQAPKGDCEVSVLDGATREVKKYIPGPQPVEFPVAGVKGWTKCRLSSLKSVTVSGASGVRVDIWCFGSAGQAMNASSVAANHAPALAVEVTMIHLLGAPTVFKRSGDDEEIQAAGYKEITLVCTARQ